MKYQLDNYLRLSVAPDGPIGYLSHFAITTGIERFLDRITDIPSLGPWKNKFVEVIHMYAETSVADVKLVEAASKVNENSQSAQRFVELFVSEAGINANLGTIHYVERLLQDIIIYEYKQGLAYGNSPLPNSSSSQAATDSVFYATEVHDASDSTHATLSTVGEGLPGTDEDRLPVLGWLLDRIHRDLTPRPESDTTSYFPPASEADNDQRETPNSKGFFEISDSTREKLKLIIYGPQNIIRN